MKGYKRNFIKGFTVPLPRMSRKLSSQRTGLKNTKQFEIKYTHHSIVMHKERKFAIISASNVDGNTWQPIIRKGNFIKDTIHLTENSQFGNELYHAVKSVSGQSKNDFDQGHLTSFQEILWGSEDEKLQAAKDTFYFTNCVPQHSLLNKGAWKLLEQYILKTQADIHNLHVSVMTGPVLKDNDPIFIHKVNGETVRIPCAFWKVIYFKGTHGLTCVGFMMSHKQLLIKDKTIEITEPFKIPSKEEYFMDFKKAGTFQVNVKMIKKISGMGFKTKGVHFPYENDDAREIIYKRIEVSKLLSRNAVEDRSLDFELQGIILD
ncbi:DNA/RNA non-specific endonuclease [Daejeonella oryzae]|uniref:DNA/RNA non-specific endonuclease n=1 Tax=Daejeonella oryzae TaxID=1122943 RepID=UPI00047A65AE|nr:DNA/RNA non-specific endonuclease [Daejeonella oryzae]